MKTKAPLAPGLRAAQRLARKRQRWYAMMADDPKWKNVHELYCHKAFALKDFAEDLLTVARKEERRDK